MPRLIILLIVLGMPGIAAAQRNLTVSGNEQRVALVIGNGAYKNASQLTNPPNDARLIADTLKGLGFAIVTGAAMIDADKVQIERAIRGFGQRLRGGAVGLFYYAGHGVQVKGENYLIPVSANVTDESDVKYELVSAGFVLDEMANAGNRLNVVILDACRNNPFGGRGLRSAGSGLAQVSAPAGTVISYATQPGNVALDGQGRNSPYTTALVAAMRKPGLGIFETFNDVGLRVKNSTGGRQQPWVAASPIEGEFQFVRASNTPSPAANSAMDPIAIKVTFWDSIKASSNPADFSEYLRQYPSGRFAGIAKNRLSPPTTQVAIAAPSSQQNQPPSVGAQLASGGSLRAQSTYPSKTRYHALFNEVSQEIALSTSGAVKVEVLPAGAVAPAFALVDAIAKGTLHGGWGSSMYQYGRDHSFGLIEAAPFGMDAAGYAAWRNDPRVKEIIDRLYRRYGAVTLACAVSAPHGDLWVKKPITKVENFKGLKLRVVGPWIELFVRLGATVNALPGGEIVPAMDRGLLDAAIFLDPRSDLELGLPDVSRIYMVSQFSGARGLEFIINAELWDKMPSVARDGITRACRAQVHKTVVESAVVTAEAVKEMQTKHNIKLFLMPQAVSAALRRTWEEYRSEEAAKNATYAELLATMQPYNHVAQRPDQSAYGLGNR